MPDFQGRARIWGTLGHTGELQFGLAQCHGSEKNRQKSPRMDLYAQAVYQANQAKPEKIIQQIVPEMLAALRPSQLVQRDPRVHSENKTTQQNPQTNNHGPSQAEIADFMQTQ